MRRYTGGVIVLHAYAQAKSDCVDAAISAATAALEPSRAEEGCVSYEFFQDPHDPTRLVWVEEWRSNEDLQSHFAEPHTVALFAAFGDLLAGPARMVTYEATVKHEA